VRLLVGQAEDRPIFAPVMILASLGVLAATTLTGYSTLGIALVALVVAVVALGHRWLLSWRALVALLILVILFIPIRRYTLPGNLPFELEPYRVLVMVLTLVWTASLLVDPRVRLRRAGIEGPVILITATAFASIIVNPSNIALVETDVTKKLTFFTSFVLVLYLVVSVVRRLDAADFLAKTLVAGGAVVAGAAVIESRTAYNPFNDLSSILPFLRLNEAPELLDRGARLRVAASAQHPIALGAALVMLVPLAIYLFQCRRQARWLACAIVLSLGCLATVSRTGIVMLLVVGVVFLWLRPRETRRFWPVLLPAVIVVHLLLPGTIGSLKQSFFPAGGLIAEQQKDPGWTGSGRIADLGPALDELKHNPLLGQGFGSRIVDARPGGFAQILDNQWLGTLLEVGVAGVVAWLWFFWRVVRRFGREAKRDPTARGWLLASIAASTAAFAVGMLTYDAFSFIQVTFLLFILVGLGSSLLEEPSPSEARAASRRRAAAHGLEYA
jgi:hypothetical protein